VEQRAGQPQPARVQGLARFGFPRVLLAVEANQAAEQEDDERDIRIRSFFPSACRLPVLESSDNQHVVVLRA